MCQVNAHAGQLGWDKGDAKLHGPPDDVGAILAPDDHRGTALDDTGGRGQHRQHSTETLTETECPSECRRHAVDIYDDMV